MTSGSTTAPTPLTESDLISRMDENGIGTDATIHSHITTIQTREYATKGATGHFLPTDLGKALVEGCNNQRSLDSIQFKVHLSNFRGGRKTCRASCKTERCVRLCST